MPYRVSYCELDSHRLYGSLYSIGVGRHRGIAMSDVTQILFAIEGGDAQAAEQLLPLVYGELWKLAAHKLAQEAPGQTIQVTALVHEAYLRLVDVEKAQRLNGR